MKCCQCPAWGGFGSDDKLEKTDPSLADQRPMSLDRLPSVSQLCNHLGSQIPLSRSPICGPQRCVSVQRGKRAKKWALERVPWLVGWSLCGTAASPGNVGVGGGHSLPGQQLPSTLVRGRAWRPGNSPAAPLLPASAQRAPAEGGGGGAQRHGHPSAVALAHARPAARADPRLPGPLCAHGRRRGPWATAHQGHHAGRCPGGRAWLGWQGRLGTVSSLLLTLLLAPLSRPSSLPCHRLPLSGRWTTLPNM